MELLDRYLHSVRFWLAGTALAAVNLFRPTWTRSRLVARAIACGLEAVVMGAFLSVATPVILRVAQASPAQQQVLQYWVNVSVRITVLAIGIFALVDGVRALWLLSRRRAAPDAVAGPAAGMRAI